jgi:glycosyltransferase involved in cell wall biosynthesis
MTPGAMQSGDAFAQRHPQLEVTRYLMPSFGHSPNLPASESHRQLEGARIQEMLPLQIDRERPDILILGREAYAWHVPEIARRHDLPCLLIVHGAATIGILSGAYPEHLARQLLEQCHNVTLLVTPAKHMAENLRRLGLEGIKVIPNPVDLQRFFPGSKNDALLRQLAIQTDDLVVVHASNLKALKRPLDLVASAEQALRQHPKLMYLVVGDGPCREAMEDACRANGIAERFRFARWVEHERMSEYLRLADMVVMPSAAETQALVYLETQACARLLLASDIPGAREVVRDGETGLLFRPGDIEDLTAKTLRAAHDAQLRADIGRKAWEHVQVHALDRTVHAYAATLEDMVQRYRG